ncbi:MAG: glycosyltransferase family 1 protein [Vicinamibacterales bacterium]|nr:hypothetical protein [Acidobacteriota bacterium]MDP6373064.1 glycosyltransferase family 1 protein [Vicinamibacterales bacterium]MDP6610106.1 glycosyltransferase family 1 protein [Vicinamibacterales bacterium]HAK55319.1 hypothetical protein [Acidobacteriota bacterium]|tara:strand:- start:1919 stop:3028 length:1110 start_codon:yes stop_codon:yes gene_type:complete
MRIGIDARELLGHPTGIGRYLASLCQAWAQSPRTRSHRFILYSPAPIPEDETRLPFLSSSESQFEIRVVPGSRGSWWEQMRLPPVVNADSPDVFFAPAYAAPLRLAMPVVLTIHDISFATHPEWFRWREGLRRRWLAARSAERAARILTVSQFTRRELIDWLGIDGERIAVTPEAVDAGWAPATSNAREPLVLFVGSIFTRRHLPWLIAAFGRALAQVPDARLAVIGANRTYPCEDLQVHAVRAGLGARITIEDWVDDARLAGYYARARVFAFLSDYEGFGLPPLEALTAGVPIVVLDTPVAREVYGDAATYVTAGDLNGVTDALVRGLAASTHALPAATEHVLARYSWTHTADLTLDALERAAEPAQG